MTTVTDNPAPVLCRIAELLINLTDDDTSYQLEDFRDDLLEIISIDMQRLPAEMIDDFRRCNDNAGISPPRIGDFSAPTAIELSFQIWERVPSLVFIIEREVTFLLKGLEDSNSVANLIKSSKEIFDVGRCRELSAMVETEVTRLRRYLAIKSLNDRQKSILEYCDGKLAFAVDIAEYVEFSKRTVDSDISHLIELGLLHRPKGPKGGVTSR